MYIHFYFYQTFAFVLKSDVLITVYMYACV